MWEPDLLGCSPSELRMRSHKSRDRVKQIKILLADYPHALPESVKNAFRALRERQDQLADDVCAYIVEELGAAKDQGPMDILMWVKSNTPDEVTFPLALVLGLGDSEESGLLDHLHATDRNLRILGVAPDMGSAFIEQLCPTRREMLKPSEESILSALCNAIRAACGLQ